MSSTKKKKSSYKEKMARQRRKRKGQKLPGTEIVLIKERREDQNPYYEPTELGSFHAVAPPSRFEASRCPKAFN